MAIHWHKNGRASITFTGPDKRRRTIRIRKIGKRDGERFADDVTELNDLTKIGRRPSGDLLQRIDALPSKLKEKLAAYGILPKHLADAEPTPTLGPFMESYVKVRSDVKGTTATVYGHTQRNLVAFFGADKPLADVTAGDADEFRLWLTRPKPKKPAPGLAVVVQVDTPAAGEGLADNTARRRCAMASQFFRAAMRKGMIEVNPFTGVGGSVRGNPARMQFITRDEADKVLAACPDLEWRLIFALSRYGGLRTPSEHYGLRWDEVNWELNKFLVHSPKTERHVNGECRWVPIFPELRSLLEAAQEAAKFVPRVPSNATPEEKQRNDAERDAASYVIQLYRNQANLRTRFRKIVIRAGLKPWPRLFQNLRSTRLTELANDPDVGLPKACKFLGNESAIAMKHYITITDDDFTKAAKVAPPRAAILLQVSANLNQSEPIGEETREEEFAGIAADAAESSDVQPTSNGRYRTSIPSAVRGESSKPEKTAAILLRAEGSGGDAHHPASLNTADVTQAAADAFERWWASDAAQGQLSYADREAARVAWLAAFVAGVSLGRSQATAETP